jgi:hypothetical protein
MTTAASNQQRVRFEEVTPTHEYAAFFDASIESLVAHLGLPIYEGYDDLDELRFAFFTLNSGKTVTLGEYLHSPVPGTSLYVDAAMQNIPQIIFDACQQLAISRSRVIWFHPDFEQEIDRLYLSHGDIESKPESKQIAEDYGSKQYEPFAERFGTKIDCFHHALQIYNRQDFPQYWAMLQHNLGLAYFNRIEGDRRENLERSIGCFYNSLEVYTQDEFPDKWQINQEDLRESRTALDLLRIRA